MLVAHCGGKVVDRGELALVEVPEITDSYMPVAHTELANMVQTLGQDLLHKDVVSERFALTTNGSRMFGTMTFGNGSEMGLTVGFRNSYDKSMSVGVCIGAKVFVCDNLSFNGDVTMLRKHTSKVWEQIETMLISTLYKSQARYDQICSDAGHMKAARITDEKGWEFLGYLHGLNILTVSQFAIAFREWRNPTFAEFAPRTVWSLYNAANNGLKSVPPAKIMEKHAALHKTIIDV